MRPQRAGLEYEAERPTISVGELSLPSDEWAWLRTPDFLRARADGVRLPW